MKHWGLSRACSCGIKALPSLFILALILQVSPLSAQVSNVTIRRDQNDVCLAWDAIPGTPSYNINGWFNLGSTRYYLGAAYATNVFTHTDVLINPTYPRYFYTIVARIATPEVSPPDGLYYVPQSVTMTCATPGAAIHYTTNASTVYTNSADYTAPFLLNNSAQIRAAGFKSGMLKSSQAARSYTLLTGSLLYYPFTDESSDDEDGVGDNNSAKIYATFTNDRQGYPLSAVAFDATATNYLLVANATAFNLEELSCSMLIKLNSDPERNEAFCLLSKGPSWGGMRIELKGPTGGASDSYVDVKVGHRNAIGNWTTITGIRLDIGPYYHLAVCRSVTHYRIYINGILRFTSIALTSPPLPNSENVLLGKAHDDDSDPMPFDGVIDNVRFVNRALSAAEVQTIAALDD